MNCQLALFRGCSDKLLWILWWTFGFYSMLRICWLTEETLAYQKWVYYFELARVFGDWLGLCKVILVVSVPSDLWQDSWRTDSGQGFQVFAGNFICSIGDSVVACLVFISDRNGRSCLYQYYVQHTRVNDRMNTLVGFQAHCWQHCTLIVCQPSPGWRKTLISSWFTGETITH